MCKAKINSKRALRARNNVYAVMFVEQKKENLA